MLNVLKYIVYIDQDHHNHQPNKQLIHRTLFNLLIDTPSTDSAQDSAGHHHQQNLNPKLRHTACGQTGQQTCNLREKDNIQGVLCRCLRRHGEEEEQHDQIDRTSADSQERGHDTQEHSDTCTAHTVFQIIGPDPAFETICGRRLYYRR